MQTFRCSLYLSYVVHRLREGQKGEDERDGAKMESSGRIKRRGKDVVDRM